MKIRNCAALLIALLTVALLAGCSARATEYHPEIAEDAVERKLDAVEDAVEKSVPETFVPPSADSRKIQTTEPKAPAEFPPAVTEAKTLLTSEEAIAIALKHAGFSADQVQFLRVEYEIDDGIPQYDIDFREGRWEYEYEIHAETGAILSFDKDD